MTLFWFLVAATIVVLMFGFVVMARAVSPIALLPNLEQCEGTHFKGNPGIIEYKCPTVGGTPQ